MSPGDDVIVHHECPKCGRVGRAGPGHAPSYSAEFERNPQPCDGQSVDRAYVAVDALRTLIESLPKRIGSYGTFVIDREDALRLLADRLEGR